MGGPIRRSRGLGPALLGDLSYGLKLGVGGPIRGDRSGIQGSNNP